VLNIQFFRRLLLAGVLLLLLMVMAACQGLSSANPSNSAGASTPLPASGTLAPGFYVATNGNDSNPGTLSLPFATLGKAQQAMRASSSVKTTYIRAGTYKPAPVTASCLNGKGSGASVELTRADKGETWSVYPPDGYNSAILDGQSTVGNSGGTGGNGTGCGFSGNTLSNITIVGLQFENYLYSAFWVDNGSNLTFTSNVVHDLTAAAWDTGAVAMACAPGTFVKNNYMYNLAYTGTELLAGSLCPGGISNDVVSGNIIENSCTWPAVPGFGSDQNGGDCGAIYFHDKLRSSTNVKVVNNYVRDVNISSNGAGDSGNCCAIGVYLDDGTGNVTVKGNIIAGIMSSCLEMSDPENNVITGNICDLAAAPLSRSIVIYTWGQRTFNTMTGNVFANNIVISASTGSGAGFAGGTQTANPMIISNNAYYNYGGSSIKTTGNVAAGSDTHPVYENPQLSGWNYHIATGSPVFNSPVLFPGISGGWGPPGFLVPPNGTPPSSPH
jgi:parallel beta helix pectate lyase-like protein